MIIKPHPTKKEAAEGKCQWNCREVIRQTTVTHIQISWSNMAHEVLVSVMQSPSLSAFCEQLTISVP